MIANDIETFEKLFHEKGLPLTIQRRVILQELLGRKDHPTADQVYEAVLERIPGLSKATVYRVLDTLVQVGAARKVFHTDAVARFDPMTARHHHVVCESCNKLMDLEGADVPDIPLPEPRNSNFRITDYSINFTGICSRCQKTSN
jgi:Fur family peroxide stress response transcriptional regulator